MTIIDLGLVNGLHIGHKFNHRVSAAFPSCNAKRTIVWMFEQSSTFKTSHRRFWSCRSLVPASRASAENPRPPGDQQEQQLGGRHGVGLRECMDSFLHGSFGWPRNLLGCLCGVLSQLRYQAAIAAGWFWGALFQKSWMHSGANFR